MCCWMAEQHNKVFWRRGQVSLLFHSGPCFMFVPSTFSSSLPQRHLDLYHLPNLRQPFRPLTAAAPCSCNPLSSDKMELIPSASTGPVLLKLQGSRSIDNGNTISIPSQQSSFQSQPTAPPSNISLFPLTTKAGLSSTVQLTSTTVPITLDKISLFFWPAAKKQARPSMPTSFQHNASSINAIPTSISRTIFSHKSSPTMQ